MRRLPRLLPLLLGLTPYACATVKAELQLAESDPHNPPRTLQMQIDRRSYGTIKLGAKSQIGDLSAVQTTALLNAIKKDREVMWIADDGEWQLSTKGANAV